MTEISRPSAEEVDIIEQLEYPLPILKVLSEKIVAETSRLEDGALAVDNIGGGYLRGRVTSNNPALKFHAQEFSGNQVNLGYTISIEGCKAGDVLQSEVVIMSNGGEKTIPVIIKVVPASITTPEDIRLTSQKDFLAYAKKYPIQARKLFVSPEFMIWLTGIGYEYMDIFDRLVKDPNKERALENFFILGKLKKRAALSVEPKAVELSAGPLQKEIIAGEITVRKTGWGYVEADVSADADWLDVSPDRLAAFSAEDTAIVKYYIDPSKLPAKLNKAIIRVAEGLEVPLVVRKKSHIAVSTDRSCYDFEDNGVLRVANNCGVDIMLEISTSDPFVRFDGKRYFMGANAEVPFTVKLNALQMAQIGLKRRPFIESDIYISARIGSKTVKRVVRVMVTRSVR